MIKIDERAKELLSKYVGPDGKLIIDESLPDDIKESFQYFNDENVNVLEFGQGEELDLDPSTEEFEPDDEEVTEEEMDLSDAIVTDESAPEINPIIPQQLSEEKIAEVNEDLNELNNMF